MTTYKDLIDEHLDWLATEEGTDAPVTNCVRERDSLAFVLVIDKDDHGVLDGEAGTYERVGRRVTGFVDPEAITLAVGEVVTYDAVRFRVRDHDPQRGLGAVKWSVNVTFEALDN